MNIYIRANFRNMLHGFRLNISTKCHVTDATQIWNLNNHTILSIEAHTLNEFNTSVLGHIWLNVTGSDVQSIL